MLPVCAFARAITFLNFSKTITLAPIEGRIYWFNNRVKVKVANRIVVKCLPGIGKDRLRAMDHRVTRVTELYKLGNGIYYALSFPDQKDLEAILTHYSASPLVLSVQPDLLQLDGAAASHIADGRSHISGRLELSPVLACMGRRHSRNRSFDFLHRLGIPALWRKTRGKGVKIAIIDDGFDLAHEDLRGVRLAFGYDVENRTLDPSPKKRIDTHGTRVAGIIFARHNGIGIDGIAPDAELVALRQPDSWTSHTLLAFYLARQSGADVINCSWDSRILLAPIADAIADLTTRGRRNRGAALVFAAGNDGSPSAGRNSEAGLAGTVAVGAVDRNGNRLSFSNFGPWVDLYTYGKNILTTNRGRRKYIPFSGTSASAAIVSGVAALFLSEHPGMRLGALRTELAAFFRQR